MKLLTQPYLLTVKPSEEMNILWIQSEKSDGFVEYGYDEKMENRIDAECFEINGLRLPKEDGTYSENPYEHQECPVWQNIALITGLEPGKTVYYRCCYGGEYTKTYSFRTAPKEGEDYRFVQVSDLQALPNCNKTVYQIGCFHPDFILFSGDANFFTWRIDQWFDMDEEWQSEETKNVAFFPCMQQENGARLMQYAPMFFCPGNHEPDFMKCSRGASIEETLDRWSWSIFMQIFRPLYPDSDTGVNGVRWYSVNYSDMHITSLSVNRMFHVNEKGKSAWLLFDSIEPDSPQIQWLRNDLKNDNSKFKWVIQHFHILNKAWDAKFNLCSPVLDRNENAVYPYDRGQLLIDIFEEYGVNAVSYGHSHVYERYFTQGTHYIEAAYLSVTFAGEGAKPHPSGLLPIVEDNSRRSFVILERKSGGIFATGYFATDDEPIAFDWYQIADEEGKSVDCNNVGI